VPRDGRRSLPCRRQRPGSRGQQRASRAGSLGSVRPGLSPSLELPALPLGSSHREGRGADRDESQADRAGSSSEFDGGGAGREGEGSESEANGLASATIS
jgi:hypothetical protein